MVFSSFALTKALFRFPNLHLLHYNSIRIRLISCSETQREREREREIPNYSSVVSASAASVSVFLLLLLLLRSLVGPVMAEVYFSSLPRNLIVSASPKPGQVLEAGVDNITITWGLNQTLPPNTSAGYKNVKVRLCYAPNSQADRGWRKTTDDLQKDKTCQFGITQEPFSEVNTTFVYSVQRNIPTATYFIRVYTVDSSDVVVAYGQTTDPNKKTDLFDVVGVTGRHASLDVAAACFSTFSVFSLVFFLVIERKKNKK